MHEHGHGTDSRAALNSLLIIKIWSTVGLLVAGTGAWSFELLGLTAASIHHQQTSVKVQELLLDFALAAFVFVLLIECHNAPSNRLSYRNYLRRVAAPTRAHSDIDIAEINLRNFRNYMTGIKETELTVSS